MLQSPSVTLDSCGSPLLGNIVPPFLLQEDPHHHRAQAQAPSQETSLPGGTVRDGCFKAQGLDLPLTFLSA